MTGNPFGGRVEGDWSIAMSNDLAGLKDGLNGLGAWLERNKIDTETENRARLVFEEIVTNITRYGFPEGGAHIVYAGASLGDGELALSFDDDGLAFDPRNAPVLQPTHSLVHASVGGRGLILVRAAARRIDYERTLDGRNRLTVTLPRP